ncbi:hypothetical protein R9C00_27050 [Flammeovirgaceae bacterium SG7u.111]|nr:hypothetical protein [Flammeovirgaceae bacterium SG7u.132]WPO35359.1 hypothetical protein R9C00_27050 [Flammeovirgaceae bacterium SG7u.111]
MFDPKQIKYFKDQDFLLTKHRIMKQMASLFQTVRDELSSQLAISTQFLPKETDISSGKISKGENYKGLPYMVLDYPRYFSKENIFLMRTMFWWGNEFSAMLILKGQPHEELKTALRSFLSQEIAQDFYLCVGDSPWEYDFGTDNYCKVSAIDEDELNAILAKSFLKLAQKAPLDSYKTLPSFIVRFWISIFDNLPV